MNSSSRRVLGFALGERHDAALAYGALAMAIAVRGRARHVPDQAVACGGERSLMGTPTSRLTRTIVAKAVSEKYS
jgi:DNA-directed RNA polymerase beta' subunit